MTSIIPDILSEDYITQLVNSPEVLAAKERIDAQDSGSVYFYINLPSEIKNILYTRIGVDLSLINSVPMRWIKGNTRPHIDSGRKSFERTHLVYLTDSSGEFCIDAQSYPIEKGCGYIFSEGVSHETIGTGSVPRLLLGPMSEAGEAVGGPTTISADGQTDTIYFSYISGSGLSCRINNTPQSVSLPITIDNTNTAYTLKVIFETDITIDSLYFICGSDNIQFGSASLTQIDELPSPPRRPVMIIDGVSNYPGFIKNFNGSTGYNNIYVYNIQVASINGSTLASGGGWVGQEYFGKGATENYIINCSSDGNIPDSAGGIVGQLAGSESGATLYIQGCSSTGNIIEEAGGIAGKYAGANSGSVFCEQCWSEGIVGPDYNELCGGIFGAYAGTNTGYAVAVKCYSMNSIGLNCGGIFGGYAADTNGIAYANTCYSRGTIDVQSGGIFGILAGNNSGTVSAINCYSSGIIVTAGNGIYGSYKVSGTEVHCYAAYDAGGWNDITANSSLEGVPAPYVGTDWIAKNGTNQPYILNNIGYTPYSTTIINDSQELVQIYSQIIESGQDSIKAVLGDGSGNAFEILKWAGGDASSYGTITINSDTGIVSTTSATIPGTYTLTIYSIGSYNISIFNLTVIAKQQTISLEQTCCERPLDLDGLDYRRRNEIIAGNTIIGSGVIKYPMTYTDLLNMKKAYASKH